MTIRRPIFVRPLPLSSVTSSASDAGHPAAHLGRHDAIGLTWKSTGGPTHWVRGQFDAARPVDFCALIAANALPGTTVRLRLGTSQAQVDGAAPYDSGAIPFISPTIYREDGLFHSHLELPEALNANWWRIDIAGKPDGFEASSLVLGKRIEPSRFYNLDFQFGVEDLGSGEFTPWGVLDENPGLIFRSIDFTLAWQSQDEFEASFRPMIERLGRRGIIYLCFDPQPGPYRQAKTYLGILRKPAFARGNRKPGYTQDFSIHSMI